MLTAASRLAAFGTDGTVAVAEDRCFSAGRRSPCEPTDLPAAVHVRRDANYPPRRRVPYLYVHTVRGQTHGQIPVAPAVRREQASQSTLGSRPRTAVNRRSAVKVTA
jgi:hypothetical protein